MLSIDKDYDYEDILIYLLEKKAEKCKIERFKIYTFEDLLSQVIDKRIPCNREARSINRLIEKVEILPIFNKDETILEVANVIFSSDNCT